MATVTAAPPGIATDEPLYRISLELYHRMVELGLLTPRDRVVLLDGVLVQKMPKGPRHSTSTQKTARSLEAILPAGWHVRKEDPVSLSGGPEGDDSEPEPDLAIAHGVLGDYSTRHPGPAEVALLVEVADSTLHRDRAGLRRYAWAGIPCVWLVNLITDVVEVYRGPSGPSANPGYSQRTDHRSGETILVLIDGNAHGPVAVSDLLP